MLKNGLQGFTMRLDQRSNFRIKLSLSSIVMYTNKVYLQSLGEQLVHLGHLRGHAQINCSVANLHNKATLDIGIDLR